MTVTPYYQPGLQFVRRHHVTIGTEGQILRHNKRDTATADAVAVAITDQGEYQIIQDTFWIGSAFGKFTPYQVQSPGQGQPVQNRLPYFPAVILYGWGPATVPFLPDHRTIMPNPICCWSCHGYRQHTRYWGVPYPAKQNPDKTWHND